MIAHIKSRIQDLLRWQVAAAAESPALLTEFQGAAKPRTTRLEDTDHWLGGPYDASAPIVFMHIPKTSGTALASALRAAVAPRRVVGGFDRGLFGGFRAFDTIPARTRDTIYLDASEMPAGGDFVAAHMALSTLLSRYSAANYLTVLREPLSRILSHWLYWRSFSADQLALWGEWAEHMRLAAKPLEHFLACPRMACQIDNLTVRMLLWPHPSIPDNDFIDPRDDEALVNEAIGRLGQFGFLDVIENPGMPINLRNWLGQPLQYVPINTTVPVPLPLKRPLHRELTPEAIDLLEARARLDQRLWTLLATHRISRASAETLQRRTILQNATRHSWLMQASS